MFDEGFPSAGSAGEIPTVDIPGGDFSLCTISAQFPLVRKQVR